MSSKLSVGYPSKSFVRSTAFIHLLIYFISPAWPSIADIRKSQPEFHAACLTRTLSEACSRAIVAEAEKWMQTPAAQQMQ
jgi:hypothetical protein